MKYNPWLKLILVFALALALLTGCSSAQNPNADNSTNTSTVGDASTSTEDISTSAEQVLEICNLTDTTSKDELKSIFQRAGIAQARQDVFFSHVERFNTTNGMTGLIDGWKSLASTASNFDEYELQDVWAAAYPDFDGYNCRITAFGLMGDKITVNRDTQADTRNLFMDEQSLQQDPSALVDTDDLQKFEQVFTTFVAANSTDVQQQISIAEQGWQDITIDSGSPVSIVTLYLHANYAEDDQELFVGHTGVLFDFGDNELYFVEKLAFQAPYRFIHLTSREQLKTYFLERYATYYGEGEATPFVLENGKPM